MAELPKNLSILDSALKAVGSMTKLGPADLFGSSRLCEADYDELIVSQLSSIADCLRQAGVLGEGRDLLHIGRQIENIDVLCAEVDQGTRAFRRLVVIEDKLCRNPEGRREVLGQIVDYSKTLHEMSFDDFLEAVPEGVTGWCEAHQVAIGQALARKQMLLVVCSDEVRESLVEYARYLSDTFPLQQMELILMSLNIYSDGVRHLFVPNVAGMLIMPERTLVIRVEVTGADGQSLATRIDSEWHTPETGGRSKIQESELLDAIGPSGAPERTVAEYLLKEAAAAGATLDYKAASVSVRIRNSETGRLATLFVLTRLGTFYIGFMRRWAEAATSGTELAREYAEALSKIIGRNPTKAKGDNAGRHAIKLSELHDKADEIAKVVGEVLPKLRDSGAPSE